MNILQIIPSLGAGGAEQAVVDINAALVQSGARSYVVSGGGNRVAEIEAAGGIHIRLRAASKNPVTMIANAYRLSALIRMHKIDVIHARSRAPAWSAWMASRLAGCPFVTTFHAAYAYDNKYKKTYNSVMARGNRVIAISNFIADHIHEEYGVSPRRIAVIHRGIDLRSFDRARVEQSRIAALRNLWQVGTDQRLVLLPARLSRIKGQMVLIEAMRLLNEQNVLTDLVAVIIGADQGRTAYVDDLMGQIMSSGLQDRIKLADHCDDMPAAYALADAVVMPSLVPEGFGRVPVEAQAMGVPVIATDLGATRETILPNVTGWLIPPDDPIALAVHLRHVLSLSETARAELAARATDHVWSCFDKTHMASATLEVYRQVMEEHSSAD